MNRQEKIFTTGKVFISKLRAVAARDQQKGPGCFAGAFCAA
jgi:hypothetical protein